MQYDYGFLDESVRTLRRLRSKQYDITCLLDAPGRIFQELDPGMAPRLLSETGGSPVISENEGSPPERVVLTRSFARKPGGGVAELERNLRNKLPEDFRQFHKVYDEVLVTSRTYPIHLWCQERIIEGIRFWRDVDSVPGRFVRFGEYWNLNTLYFGLWQRSVDPVDWCVVLAEWGDRDQEYDFQVSPEFILAPSFHEWLRTLVESDGLPDPYMRIGPEGGFLEAVE